MPSAGTYVASIARRSARSPSVWGSFTYRLREDSVRGDRRAKSYGFAAVQRELRATKGYRGATGAIAIDPKTGYRATVPVSILRVDNRKRFVIAS